ncbi:MAG: helix-turn-helix transcriptional regulator [Dokdonella sp.]|nr:helix-turn-helix transcriptional regulator [Dokdonella sp.]MCB1574441.1 helix-turn-helix transcriptional regulator [Xanthomonadales bacterium]MCB1576097.1 helix-turn-helix transcriptional regulator [Xanthomonadales bacterium]
MSRDRFKPVKLDPAATLERWSRDREFARAYDALADEFAALAELVSARQSAGLTQSELANRMGIAQASVARLESSAGSRKHAPSFATLRRYAEAVGCELRISLTPKARAGEVSGQKKPRPHRKSDRRLG